jgi:purine-binding chemotaxis protein CheW
VTETLPTWFDDDVVELEDPGVDHVVVRLGGGRYGLAARDVAEVVPVPRVTRVPGSPVLGASAWANWRGHVLPVIDSVRCSTLPVTPLPTSARLVVVSVDDVEVGLVAEAVSGLVPVPDPCSPAPAGLTGGSADLVRGLADGGPAGPVAVLGTRSCRPRIRPRAPAARAVARPSTALGARLSTPADARGSGDLVHPFR